MATNIHIEQVAFNWMMGIGVGAPYNLPKQTISNNTDNIQIAVVSSLPISSHPNIIVLSETFIIPPHNSVSFIPRIIRLDSVPPIAQIPGITLTVTVVDLVSGSSCAPSVFTQQPATAPTPMEQIHMPYAPVQQSQESSHQRRKRRVRLNDDTLVSREEYDQLKSVGDPRTIGVVIRRREESDDIPDGVATTPSVTPVSDILQMFGGGDTESDGLSIMPDPEAKDSTADDSSN